MLNWHVDTLGDYVAITEFGIYEIICYANGKREWCFDPEYDHLKLAVGSVVSVEDCKNQCEQHYKLLIRRN